MVSDEIYDLCLPVLKDEAVDEDDRAEKILEILEKETSLTGKNINDIVLDVLWRFRDAGTPSTSPPPSRHNVIRRPSPAPWQIARTPTPSNSSPRIGPPPGFGIAPPAFNRAKSSTASPFTSPRPSPRLAFATPHIPHSPSLNAYEFSGAIPHQDTYGDLDSDTVDWLINDESGNSESSSLPGEMALNGGAAEWIQPQMDSMSVYDMLRSVLREEKTDEELERALEANGYDLSATLMSLNEMFAAQQATAAAIEAERTILVGKSMSPSFRPTTPAGQAKSNILCKYWLSTGNCARADCRFSHDPSKTLCKYWVNGNCLAGDTCMFSHDPSILMARMMIDNAGTPPPQNLPPNFQIQDYESFPALQAGVAQQQFAQLQNGLEPTVLEQLYGAGGAVAPPPGLNPYPNFGLNPSSRPHSRPSSRHHSRAPTPSAPAVDDNDAFPTLGSAAAVKGPKRHHGKRGGHGHAHKENGPNTLADLVRMSPSPGPAQMRKARATKGYTGSRENSTAAQAIPAPEHIPWLETGEAANKAYLKARQEAFKHGGLRNKFLQSAAQAWNRNDSRAAKALSLRGQSENNLMREAHREAARHLYEERNKDNGPNARELYVDLHGLHPEEAVQYLERILLTHQSSSRPLYAITGTGHHSKNGKDKVGKAVRGFLNEWGYAFREFTVPTDRGNVGGILGIDPSSYDKNAGERTASSEDSSAESKEGKERTKVRVVKEVEVPKGPRGRQPAGL